MLFNSSEFLLFLPIVFTAYWLLNRIQGPRGLKWQNLLLLVASYVFYGWWDWRFLGLIAFSTAVDFLVGLQIERANARDIQPDADPALRSPLARRWLGVSLLVNLGLLGYFKYANFFIENWIDAWGSVGVQMNPWSLKVILPVGISFYTFQTLSYSIDIYRRQLKPTHDFIEFAAFVSFFPQLVAGPIERASRLLPQIQQRRIFDSELAIDGLKLIIWGLVKKIVVADTCALYVNDIFHNYEAYSGATLLVGAVLFSLQIYGDFSGYSDIAIGTARLFGMRLMTNFMTPYFARDIADFWRRWHISLSTWFRDYLYIPLGGSRVGRVKAIRNTFVIFIVSGFWHGANWTFIIWGAIHALLFLPLLLLGRNRLNTEALSGPPSIRQAIGIAGTFLSVAVAWVFFRADSLVQALRYLAGIVNIHGEFLTPWTTLGNLNLMFLCFACCSAVTLELLSVTRFNKVVFHENTLGLWAVLILAFYQHNQAETFIYFQF